MAAAAEERIDVFGSEGKANWKTGKVPLWIFVFLFGKGCFQGLIFAQYAIRKIQTVELDRLWFSPALLGTTFVFHWNSLSLRKQQFSHPR